jgi:hypothetical protein
LSSVAHHLCVCLQKLADFRQLLWQKLTDHLRNAYQIMEMSSNPLRFPEQTEPVSRPPAGRLRGLSLSQAMGVKLETYRQLSDWNDTMKQYPTIAVTRA